MASQVSTPRGACTYGYMGTCTHTFSLSLPLCTGSNTLPGNLRAKFAGHVCNLIRDLPVLKFVRLPLPPSYLTGLSCFPLYSNFLHYSLPIFLHNMKSYKPLQIWGGGGV